VEFLRGIANPLGIKVKSEYSDTYHEL
jgi:hypothetical protein